MINYKRKRGNGSRNVVEYGYDAGQDDRCERQEVEVERNVEYSLDLIDGVAASVAAAPIRKFDS